MARKKKPPVEEEEDVESPYEDESAFDELMENPRLPQARGELPMETSYDKALNILTVTENEELELMTRATPLSSKASAVAYSMCFTFGSRYTKGRIDQIHRLAVSMGGEGRKEIVSSLSANSGAFEIPGLGEGANSSPFMPAEE